MLWCLRQWDMPPLFQPGLDGRMLSATSVKVGEGYRLALPTGRLAQAL